MINSIFYIVYFLLLPFQIFANMSATLGLFHATDPDEIKQLIKAGADINQIDKDNFTAYDKVTNRPMGKDSKEIKQLLYPKKLIQESIEKVDLFLKGNNPNFDIEKTYHLAFNCSKRNNYPYQDKIACQKKVLEVIDKVNTEHQEPNQKPFSCFVVSGIKSDNNQAFKNRYHLLNREIINYNGHYCKVVESFDELTYYSKQIVNRSPKKNILVLSNVHMDEDSCMVFKRGKVEAKEEILESINETLDQGHHLALITSSCYDATILREKLQQDHEWWKGSTQEEKETLFKDLKNFCLITSGGIDYKGKNTNASHSSLSYAYENNYNGKDLWYLFQQSTINTEANNSPLSSALPWRSFKNKSFNTLEKLLRKQDPFKIESIYSHANEPLCYENSKIPIKSIDVFADVLAKLNNFQPLDPVDKARLEGCQSFIMPKLK